MNYGKYFRLNLWESKIVDGVAVYDYIDLPAYFGSSADNLISPKYPITAVISKDAVKFRLHYCTFRQEGVEVDAEGNEVKNVKYFYSAGSEHSAGSDRRLVHMQEVILELPFSGGGNESLAEIISKIYFTCFPLLTEFDANIENDGYVNQILSKRYSPDLWAFTDEGDFEKESYLALQKNIDGDRSYSSIWLMDLQAERQINGRMTKVINLCLDNASKDKPKYVGFLRKLLLDFMFDLVHSDIFQSSPHYNEMLSGFESDNLFSALLHKCEYYYYRDLTLDALESIERSPHDEQKDKKKQVKMLYASQLLDAEKKWVEDIISPSSDQLFKEPQDDFSDEWKDQKEEKAAQSIFRIYPYWFASPEEEMQRVCFTMSSSRYSFKTLFRRKSSDSLKVHLCNSETLAHYLKDDNKSDKDGSKSNKESFRAWGINLFQGDKSAIGQLRTKISKWFFKRYDFQDAWRLHLFRGFATVECVILIVAIVLFMVFPDVVDQQFWKIGKGKFIAIVLGGILISLTMVSAYCAFIRPLLHRRKDDENKITKSILWPNRVTLAWKRVFWLLLFLVVCIGMVFLFASHLNPIWKIIGAILSIGLIVLFCIKTSTISNIHVLYPRLFASITAAWLTLAIGNELFSAFFDASPSFLACLFLGIIVFVFILYEINRHYPLLGSGTKIVRSLQMLVYSYAISLIVGLCIINFTGREFLERSDYLPKFFEEYVVIPDSTVAQLSSKSVETAYGDSLLLAENITADSSLAASANINHTDSTTHPQAISHAEKGDERHHKRHQIAPREHRAWRRPSGIIEPVPGSNRYLLEELERSPVPGRNHFIVSVWRSGDKTLFFILRDFLIQFAFLAMFIGVFIQMIFEEKSLTEM